MFKNCCVFFIACSETKDQKGKRTGQSHPEQENTENISKTSQIRFPFIEASKGRDRKILLLGQFLEAQKQRKRTKKVLECRGPTERKKHQNPDVSTLPCTKRGPTIFKKCISLYQKKNLLNKESQEATNIPYLLSTYT